VGNERDEFAEFYRASRDSCLKAVTAVVVDRQLAEEQVAEDRPRRWRIGPGQGQACPLKVFGAMLAYYRNRIGMTPEQLGARVYLSGSQIRKVEAGTRTPS